MNDQFPGCPLGTGDNLSPLISSQSSWKISLLLQLMVVGIGVSFVYWVGWPQPVTSLNPTPSPSASESGVSTGILSSSTASISETAGHGSAGWAGAVAEEKSRHPGEGNSYIVDLNNSSAAEFEHLPGIGPVLAGRIVAHRSSHGAFRRVEDLLLVPGIGEKRFQQFRSFVQVQERSR